jgi:tRNA G46 methylase TrmB
MLLVWAGYTPKEILSASISKETAFGAAQKRRLMKDCRMLLLSVHILIRSLIILPGEVSEIWITFPDPQLRGSRAKKRLTHPKFLRLYQQVLKENGLIHLKTDSPDLYRFTLAVIHLFELEL